MPVRTFAGPTPIENRINNLYQLLTKLGPVPTEWIVTPASNGHRLAAEGLPPLQCRDYKTLVKYWKKATKWRQVMDDVLSLMLAVCISTEQTGDQLFMMVVGDASGGKTKFCEALLVSKSCYPLEHLTGFYSGYKGDGSGDHSLIARINRKTLITPEADVIVSNAKFQEIMSQQRRIFDGTGGADFKNMKEAQRYTGLRTPWIMAGTHTLLDTDQSRLGDRFLKLFLDSPDQAERFEILKHVADSAWESVQIRSKEGEGKIMEPKLAEAYQFTGGYVDWLRDNTDLIASVDFPRERRYYCAMLGELTSFLRARPNPNPDRDSQDGREQPHRLAHQFVRAAMCLAVVLNKHEVDEEVLRRITKLSLNTGYGQTLDIVRMLAQQPKGLDARALATILSRGNQKMVEYTRFLKRIGAIQPSTTTNSLGVNPDHRQLVLSPLLQDIYMRATTGDIPF